MIFLAILPQILPRFLSIAAFLCLMLAQCECPAMRSGSLSAGDGFGRSQADCFLSGRLPVLLVVLATLTGFFSSAFLAPGARGRDLQTSARQAWKKGQHSSLLRWDSRNRWASSIVPLGSSTPCDSR